MNMFRASVLGLLAGVLLYGHAAGPDPRYTGAPGDDPKACSTSGCHVGTALNGGGGSVQVSFPNGSTYTPGLTQTFIVTVSDPKAKVYGFQMSARLASNAANGQAGDFNAATGQIVLCDNGLLKGASGCSSKATVEFIEHDTPSKSGVWQVTWTPPTSNVGNVTIYVAGNGANGDGEDTGDHIYTANYTLTYAAPTGNKPTVTSTSVVSASAFNPKAGVASGTWLEIFGSDIAPVSGEWAGGNFVGNSAPTNLNGVSVTINGNPAFVRFTSANQVNVQVPDDDSVGPVQLVVTNLIGSSDPVTVQKLALAPALLAPPSAPFVSGGHQYAVAQLSDGSFVGPASSSGGGVTFRPAKVGDILILYGIGFGPVNPSVAAGTIATEANSLVNTPTFLFGQTPGKILYDGLAPGFVGLYQFNVTVPSAGTGDVPLNVSAGGVKLSQTLYLTLQ